tara:strand:+ start:2222 stop:2860 length:639 start_codon:yes stop_codon:yes gene_type:complete
MAKETLKERQKRYADKRKANAIKRKENEAKLIKFGSDAFSGAKSLIAGAFSPSEKRTRNTDRDAKRKDAADKRAKLKADAAAKRAKLKEDAIVKRAKRKADAIAKRNKTKTDKNATTTSNVKKSTTASSTATKKVAKKPTTTKDSSFGAEFKKRRALYLSGKGKGTFEWKGKKFHTRHKGESSEQQLAKRKKENDVEDFQTQFARKFGGGRV